MCYSKERKDRRFYHLYVFADVGGAISRRTAGEGARPSRSSSWRSVNKSLRVVNKEKGVAVVEWPVVTKYMVNM